MSPVWKTVISAALAAGVMAGLESYVEGVQSPKALATSAAVAAAMVVIAYLKRSPVDGGKTRRDKDEPPPVDPGGN